jgi:hypothetical protein
VCDCIVCFSPPQKKKLLFGTVVFSQTLRIKLETGMSVLFQDDICHISAQKVNETLSEIFLNCWIGRSKPIM